MYMFTFMVPFGKKKICIRVYAQTLYLASFNIPVLPFIRIIPIFNWQINRVSLIHIFFFVFIKGTACIKKN